MDQPPMCFFGCCNVKTWALFSVIFEFVIAIVQFIITLLFTTYVIVLAVTGSMDIDYFVHLLILIVTVTLLAIDLGLRMELFEHSLTEIQFGLRIYVTVFIVTMFILIVNIIGYFSFHDDMEGNIKKIWQISFIFSVIIAILLYPCYYPIYQYYEYEKMKLQSIIPNDNQTTNLNDIELEVTNF